MKMRLSPLNFVSAALVVTLIYPLLDQKQSKVQPGWLSLVLVIVLCSVADLLFRTFLRDLKRIWIVEVIFIIFAAIVLLVLGKASLLQ
ncbi:hypothetical protein [Arcticibacter sp. MXS-1]|uniref:hypothetical protein n=1 Tax=Arcticibacter sp. MXS-1 TaxID=3341726 RepID=UPI0035A84AB6